MYGTPFPSHEASCARCGETFKAGNLIKKYCSDACAFGLTCGMCGACMRRCKTSKPQGEAFCDKCRVGNIVKHGIVSSYNKGCRCDECKAAKAEQNRKYKEEYRAIHGVGPSSKWKRDNGGMPPRVEWIDRKVRRTIYERDNWICWLCNEAVDIRALPHSDFYPSLDHIIPRSKGGSHEPKNLRTAHRLCNAKRRDLDVSKVGDLFGWKEATSTRSNCDIRGYSNATEVPISGVC